MKRLVFCFTLISSAALADPLDQYIADLEMDEAQRIEAYEDAKRNCSTATATTLEVRDVATRSMLLAGDCVTLTGVAHIDLAYTFVYPEPIFVYYSDREEAWRDRLGAYRNGNPFRVGIERNDLPQPMAGPWFYQVTVTGVIKDCASFADYAGRGNDVRNLSAGPEDGIVISMLGGFCHTFYAPVIDPVSIEYGQKVEVPRLTDSEATYRTRSLWRLSPEWPVTNDLTQAALEYLQAIRSGSIEGLSSDSIGPLDVEDILSLDPMALRELRGSRDVPDMAFFAVSDGAITQQPDVTEDESFRAAACMCRDGSCENLWPISVTDTRPNADYPYTCIAMSVFLEEGERVARVSNGLWRYEWYSPFLEPVREPSP